jgi:RecA-family ATPase
LAVQDDDSAFPPGASKEKPKKKPNGELPNDLPIPKGESAFALTERDIPDPVRLCDPWATEGVTILAGRPKLGKTTLERQKLAAAASGSAFLDSTFTKPVLCAFLSLEEGELLTRMKFKQANFSEAALIGIDIHFTWERGAIGVEQLERYLDANPDVQFVVIDSLSRFRTVPDVRTPAFMADYEAMSLLNECSKRHPGVCIDVIHHTRKMKGDDPMDDISGTYGLTAAATTCIVLRHHADGATMFIEGRLWTRNDNNYILKRAGGQWEMVGVNIGLPDEQIQTLDIIKAHPEGIGGTALGNKLGITQPSAWQRIDILIEKGFVVKRHGRAYIKGVVP